MKTLADLVIRNEALFGDDVCVVQADRRFTNRQHVERARRLSAALHDTGCLRQDRVSILAMNTTEYVEVFSACWLAAFTVSTVNFRLATPEFLHILTDTAPRVLIFEVQYAAILAPMRELLPSVETYVCIGGAPDWAVNYETFLAGGAAAGAPSRPEPSDIAHIIYTSGTTGRAKGVMRSHACELALAEAMACVMDIRPRGRVLVVMPFFHAGAQSSTLAQMWRGGEVHIHRAFDAGAVLAAVASQKITHLHLVPLMVQSIVELPGFGDFDLASVQTILYAAAPMPAPVLAKALGQFGPVFVNSWGMTEGSGTCLPKHMHAIDGPDVALLGSIGQTQQRAEIRIVDEDGGDCPIGVAGELWLRSEAMMTGYWNNSAATVEVLRDGWLHTGDMGYFDEARRIFLVDRKKDMIISGGENIYSLEVERALAEHPSVSQVAVIGRPDAKWGEAVVAVVVLRPGDTPREQTLIDFCSSRIASYKKPKHIIFVEGLPVVASGKVDKKWLRERYAVDAI